MSDISRSDLPTTRSLPRIPFTVDGTILRLVAIVFILFGVFSLIRPDAFPTIRNLQSMAFQASEIGILAIAVGVTMLTGGIDLSINATANLTAVLAASVLTAVGADSPPLAIALALVAAVLVGAACGCFNGVLVAYLGIPPILATLGTLTLYQGIGTVITEGAAVFGIPEFQFIGNGSVLGVPVPFILFLLIAAVIGVVLTRTKYGFEVYLIGTNPLAARFSGVNNRRVLMRTYIISGLLSAIAGLIILGRTNAARVDFGESYILLTIMICVLGGISPAGGRGRVIGIVLALIALQFLSTGVNMALFERSGANFFREAAWGATLLIVLLVEYFSSRWRLRSRQEKFMNDIEFTPTEVTPFNLKSALLNGISIYGMMSVIAWVLQIVMPPDADLGVFLISLIGALLLLPIMALIIVGTGGIALVLLILFIVATALTLLLVAAVGGVIGAIAGLITSAVAVMLMPVLSGSRIFYVLTMIIIGGFIGWVAGGVLLSTLHLQFTEPSNHWVVIVMLILGGVITGFLSTLRSDHVAATGFWRFFGRSVSGSINKANQLANK